MKKHREEMPDKVYLFCTRCGSEFVEIPLRWTVMVEQDYQNELLFTTTVKTSPQRHTCAGTVSDD